MNPNDIDKSLSAFPVNSGNHQNPAACYPESGMTLRDYFAAKAMAGDLASQYDGSMWLPDGFGKLASRAYAVADAMLAARKAGA